MRTFPILAAALIAVSGCATSRSGRAGEDGGTYRYLPAPAPYDAPNTARRAERQETHSSFEQALAEDREEEADGEEDPPKERIGPKCKKGIPCGNSCIAASKTCRIGKSKAGKSYKPKGSGSKRYKTKSYKPRGRRR